MDEELQHKMTKWVNKHEISVEACKELDEILLNSFDIRIIVNSVKDHINDMFDKIEKDIENNHPKGGD